MKKNYILLFVILVLIQVLVLDAIYISSMVAPLIYIAFMVLLPTDTKPMLTMFLGLLLGLTVDLLSGTPGLNTIATLAVGYGRPNVLRLIAGEDILRERTVASVRRLGIKDFTPYALILIMGHGLLFFLFEVLTFSQLHITLFKVLCSGLVTTLLTIFISAIFTANQK